MNLTRNFKIDSTASGWSMRFLYLAESGRFQVYLGGRDRYTDQFDPEHTYLDETKVWLNTKKEGQKLANQFMLSGETPDDMAFT